MNIVFGFIRRSDLKPVCFEFLYDRGQHESTSPPVARFEEHAIDADHRGNEPGGIDCGMEVQPNRAPGRVPADEPDR